MTSTNTEPTFVKAPVRHRLFWIEILLSSITGMVASLVLSAEAITLAANPLAQFSCDISSKISCSAVGSSWQASLLGFPNAFLGLLAEPVITTVAVASLAGVLFPRWFMRLAQVVSSIGFIFAYWLFYQAYFVIGALCPWCLLITVTTTLIFFSITRINLLEGHYGEKAKAKFGKLFSFYHIDTLTAVLVLGTLTAMVIFKYL